MNILFHIFILLIALYIYFLIYNFNIKNNILQYHTLNNPSNEILNNFYCYKQPILIKYNKISNFYNDFINNKKEKVDFKEILNINPLNNYNLYNIINCNKILHPKNNIIQSFQYNKKEKNNNTLWQYNLEEITNIIVLKDTINIKLSSPEFINKFNNITNDIDYTNIFDLNNNIYNENLIMNLNKNSIELTVRKNSVISIPAYWSYNINSNIEENSYIIIKYRSIINILSIIKNYIENHIENHIGNYIGNYIENYIYKII